MKLWRFEYGTYEEHEETWLMKDTTEERFRADSIHAYVEACREAINVGQTDVNEGISYVSGILSDGLTGSEVQTLYSRAVKAMERKGYLPLNSEADFSPFGWASVMQKDWSGHADDDLVAIREAIKKAKLTEEMVRHWTKKEIDEYWEKENEG